MTAYQKDYQPLWPYPPHTSPIYLAQLPALIEIDNTRITKVGHVSGSIDYFKFSREDDTK